MAPFIPHNLPEPVARYRWRIKRHVNHMTETLFPYLLLSELLGAIMESALMPVDKEVINAMRAAIKAVREAEGEAAEDM